MHHPSTPFPTQPLGGSLEQADAPEKPESITALVSRCFRPATDVLLLPKKSTVGDVVGMLAGPDACKAFDWKDAPDMRPLLIEVSVGLGEAEALALAERRAALVRRLLSVDVDFDVENAGYALA
jgi:hypothetical protein